MDEKHRQQLEQVGVFLQKNRFHEALKLCLEVLNAEPNSGDVLYMLAVIAFRLQQPSQALQWLDRALQSEPKMSNGWLLRARVLRMLHRPEEAMAAADEATRTGPNNPDAWHCAGFLKMALGRWKEAEADLSRSVTMAPSNPVVRSQYALALNENERCAEAFTQVQEALRQAQNHPEIMMAKADILESAGYYDLARRYRPNNRIVTFSQVSSFFLTGSFSEGLGLIAARAESLHPTLTTIPLWKGQEDFGLHLVLSGEQGYGDMIQFLRYVPLLRQRVGKVTVRLPVPLIRLVRGSMPQLPLVAFQDPSKEPESLPAGIPDVVPTDVGAHARMMSVPQHVLSHFDFLSSSVPYIKADDQQRAAWRERLAAIPHPWVGVVWAGNPRHTNDHKRSIPFANLAPLIAAGRDHLISLQMSGAKAEGVFDASPYINDFTDTAALVAELDLLITIDSAPAHLGGAMARPVWTLLPFNPDWRWLLGREDTPWYPTMRLMRQTTPGDWPAVIAKTAVDLAAFLAGDTGVLTPKIWQGQVLSRHPQALSLPGIDQELSFQRANV